jgi:hypothetical protein
VEVDKPSWGGFFGVFTTNAANTEAMVSWAMDSMNDTVAGKNQSCAFTHNTATNAITLNSTAYPGPVKFVSVLDTVEPNGVLEGGWSGVVAGCIQTFQITATTFRAFQANCNGPNNGGKQAFMGTVTMGTATTTGNTVTGNMVVQYAYSTFLELQGANKTIGFNLTTTATTKLLTLLVPAGAETMLQHYYQVIDPVAMATLDVRLNGNYTAFLANATVQAAIIQDLANQLGVSPSRISIISTQAGSIIIKFAIADDILKGVTAADAIKVNISALGSYPVISQTVTQQPFDNTGSRTNSGASVVPSSFVFTCVFILFAKFVCL